MKINNRSGIALIMTLFFAVVLYALSTIFILATINEKEIIRKERELTKAFYTAHGGAQQALEQIDILINDFLLNTISSAYPSSVVSLIVNQVAAGDGIGWLVFAVRDNNVPVLVLNGEQAEYSANGMIGGLNYQYDIVLMEKQDPMSVGIDMWDLPYSYRIEATGSSGGLTSEVIISGDFTVRLQRDNFSRFALFTNTQTTPGGSNVWFTDKTNFAGPVHTNGRFNFAFNPSGTFEEIVSQQEQTTRFYNNGSPVLLDAAANGTKDVPTFNDSFDRGVNAVVLDSPVVEQDMIDQASGGQTITTQGIYVPHSGGALTGGIFVEGDGNIVMSVDGNNNAVYTVAQGTTTQMITIDQTNNQTTVFDVGSGTSQTYSGLPDGVDDVGTLVYVDGNITDLGGTVQADTQLTVASRDDIIINNHVRYENFTPAVGNPGDAGYIPPSAENTTNLLGIVSWGGNVRIGTSAPDNIDIHATILASSGIFTVDNYTNQGVGPRGNATLLGGVITDNYGAFGLFSGSSGQQLSGYGRNFVYDQRMKQGQSSPYFPSLSTFIAFTNDITDKMVWQEGE